MQKLGDACTKYDCELHAYVLMTNHVHLLLTPNSENGISKVMQYIGRYYVQYFNFQYQRTGSFWEGRYRKWGTEARSQIDFLHTVSLKTKYRLQWRPYKKVKIILQS